ncbi:O-antigen ligase family protein [Epibacterium ulvae]|uniref:O-antigen ligase family protein n=1 Tax=Epibacterium ulvae TaxID=1156985 RepID=UPI001BFC6754|nr:O-antigen ligase family protein [Epibacterium ulvae]MBT8155927.1 O-antigen ligase family protein [Epibacterium ulvae]
MSLAADIMRQPVPKSQNRAGAFWPFVDMSLLFLVVLASSDALVHLGFGQSLVWLLCYAVTLMRVTMMWPVIFEMLMRNRVILIYPAACLASVLWSYTPTTTLSGAIQICMTFLIAAYLGWRYSLEVLVKTVACILIVTVVLSLMHWATGIFPWRVYSDAGGLVGVFSHKNMLGQRALFCVIAIIAILMMPKWRASGRLKLYVAGGLMLTIMALFLSRSMTSVLLLFPAFGMMMLFCRRHVPQHVFVVMCTLVLAAVALGPIAMSLAGIDLVNEILGAVGKDATLTGRTELWHVAMEVSQEYPLFGVGYGAFWQAPEFSYQRLLTQHAGAVTSVSFHNFFLEILVGTGVLGAIGILAFVGATLRRLITHLRATGSVSSACGLVFWFAIILTSLLGPSLYRGHEFMFVLMVMFFVSAQEDLIVSARPRPKGAPVDVNNYPQDI